MNTPNPDPGMVLVLVWLAPCGCELELTVEHGDRIPFEQLVDTGAKVAGMLLTQANNRLQRHQCRLVSATNPNGIAEAH